MFQWNNNHITFNYRSILNYFENRSTNTSAESFNAKIKAFRSQFRGVRKIDFFCSDYPIFLPNPQLLNLILNLIGFTNHSHYELKWVKLCEKV
ncbi:transposase [Flavobacterium fluviatile]|uniref:transposase n=1 Tax=Flavobacterium fluviatile TaxID=1862387 RepID=UPI001FCB90EB|nr:transposase [Flavobacterium fluviatile]